MELKEIQILVDKWIKKYGVRYFNELTNTVILMEEVGELARIMARKYGEQSDKENEKSDKVGEEIADILFVLICLANQMDIDIEKEFLEKMKKKTVRDKERHIKNKKLQ